MRALAFIPLCLLGLALAACAGNAPRTAGASAGKAAAPAKGPGEAQARYLAALAAARAGDPEAERQREAALDELREGAVQCSRKRGCDPAPYIDTFDRLLREDDKASSERSAGLADNNPEATAETGEDSPVVAAIPELRRSVSLLKGRELSEVMTLNSPVKAALEAWLTQYRPNLISAWENYQHMRYLMAPEYDRAGLPEAILFGMMAQESGGKVHAVSRSGASGPLQFMPATGRRFGLGVVDGFDQRFDPQLSARANAAYLNEQLAIFNNDLELVIGAYNGGEGAMRRRVAAAGGAVGFWDPKIYYDLSVETREYVPMVLAAAWLYLHPERYNLSFPEVPNTPGAIQLARPASLAELTICLGQDAIAPAGWFRTLRNLNPSLDPQAQEPAGARIVVPAHLEHAYRERCSAGPWAELAADLHAAAPPRVATTARKGSPAASSRSYKVARGDTLSAIARRSGCGSIRDIAHSNGLRPPHYPIKPGQVLRLDHCRK